MRGGRVIMPKCIYFLPRSLPPFARKDIYIMGKMTANALDDSTKLSFNEAKGVYEITLLLKQGFIHILMYKRRSIKNSKPQTAITDGDYWETENSYTGLGLLSLFRARYDELLVGATINSKFGTQ
jgi:hypothetical protein